MSDLSTRRPSFRRAVSANPSNSAAVSASRLAVYLLVGDAVLAAGRSADGAGAAVSSGASCAACGGGTVSPLVSALRVSLARRLTVLPSGRSAVTPSPPVSAQRGLSRSHPTPPVRSQTPGDSAQADVPQRRVPASPARQEVLWLRLPSGCRCGSGLGAQ